MDKLTKSDSLNKLLAGIEKIDLTIAETETIENFMAATKVLEDFTKKVKQELLIRLENGQEISSYTLSSRSTKKVEDEAKTVKALESLGFDIYEVFDSVLKSPKELIAMVGTKNADKLGIVETKTTFIKRKRGK